MKFFGSFGLAIVIGHEERARWSIRTGAPRSQHNRKVHESYYVFGNVSSRQGCVVDEPGVVPNPQGLAHFQGLPSLRRLLCAQQESDNIPLLPGMAETSQTTQKHRHGRDADNEKNDNNRHVDFPRPSSYFPTRPQTNQWTITGVKMA